MENKLQFSLGVGVQDLAVGMARAKATMISGLRRMSEAARQESGRISQAMADIKGFGSLSEQSGQLKKELSSLRTEAERLGNAWRLSTLETDRMVGSIEQVKRRIGELKSVPKKDLTLDQKTELEQLGKRYANLNEQLKGLQEQTRVFGKDQKNANHAVLAASEAVGKNATALEAMRNRMRLAGVDTHQLVEEQKRLQTAMAGVMAKARDTSRIQSAREILGVVDHRSIEREIQRVEAAYERLRKSGKATPAEMAQAHLRLIENTNNLRESTNGWAAAISRAREQFAKLAVTVAGMGLAAREAIQFESAMANVSKVVDFPTPKAFKELTADIKSMSREIPLTLVELAKIAEAGGQMGIASKDIREFTDVVAKMSTAFKMPADEAGTSVGRLMNVFALTVPQTRLLADAINHLGNNTNAVEEDIVEVMNRTGGMARVFGLANTETAALAATFLSMGLGPERASTAINALTRELMNAPQQTDKFKAALQRVGLTSEEMSTKIRQGPQKAIMDLLQALSGLDDQTKLETLVGLFGDEFSDDIVQVVNNLDKYKEILGLVGKESGYAGSMQKEFGERIKTTEAQLQLAKNAISEAAVNLGNVFLPAIVAVAKAVASLMHGMAAVIEKFPQLSAAAVTALTAFAGFVALRLVWSALRAGVTAMVAPLATLGTAVRGLMFTPLGAVLTAAGIAAYAFSKATASSVPSLLENAEVLGKSREATVAKIKALEELKKTLETTQPGTKAHTDAEEKLAAILPNANQSLDEQGRVLARVGNAASDNAGKINAYLDLLKKDDSQTLALQLEAQTRAFGEAKKEMASYVEDLRNTYGIGTGEAATGTQKFWLTLNKLTGTYDDNIAKGAELRRQLGDTQGGLKALLEEALKAGLSVEDLGRAMDGIHADPAVKDQAIALYRDMAGAAEMAAGKTASLAEQFKQFSDALAGPATAAKKIIVDAIGVADQQLGKYNEALGQHREKLRQAVDDESKSWKTMADISSRAFETTTQEIEDSYAQRRVMLQDEVDAYRGAERKKSEFASDRARFEIEEKKFSQQAILQTTNDLVINEHNSKLSRAQRYLTEALTLSEREYRGRIDNAKRLGVEAGRIDEERLSSQKNILMRVEEAYRQNIDKLIEEEKRHRDAAKQLAEERKSFNESIADRIMNVKEKGMDPAEVDASRQKRIVQEQILAQEALRAGNYELARKHAERMISLAEQTSDAVQVGDRTVIDSKAAAARAIEQMQKAAEIENQAFKGESEAHKQAANSLKEQSNSATESLAKIRDAIKSVDEDLAWEHVLLVDANIEKVHAAGKEIDALLEKKERVISIKAELQGGATALESVVNDVLHGATSKAQASIDEVSLIFSRFKTEFASFTPEVKANFDIASATGAIDGLVTKFNEFKAAVSPEAKVLFIGDASQAMGEIDGLITRINAIPLEKTIIVNYVEKQTEAKANGGPVGFARGGFLPGWGSKDDVPALLQRGEFVLRKEAVQRYGLGLIQSMNQMRIRPGTIPGFAYGGLVRAIHNLTDLHSSGTRDIPHFASGGLLRNLVIPELPRMAFAGGGSVSPQVTEVVRLDIFNNNRPSTSITAPRDQVRDLVRTLQDLTRGAM
ncbi:MAG: phage tail tape measure protein [Nitrospirae bacterium]|nr:phage tail tape measure protein [Magnetococcales bacterium]